MDVDGKRLPAEAREAVRAHLAGEGRAGSLPGSKSGVFVTITDSRGLRGCIGYAEPALPLHEALRLAAVAAATEDPRFDPLRLEELDTVQFEVTVLDEPVLIRAGTPQEYISSITPGRNGLMVRRGEASGLLLPQVAAEYGWSAREFLENTCRKAGLDPDSWTRPGTDVYRFGGRVFTEQG
ncbi:MAG: TIGR00296 family protein [Nitrosopumilaceae archaeon]|nr:TIGR00296 family protein [Nitrosopumilaceae archaeon]